MKAAIYNPYLDTLGGGERYTMGFAKAIANAGWKVDVEWKDPEIKRKLSERFGIDLTSVNFIPNVNKGDGYDLCFWVSDGSIPLLRARKNLIHFQVPFHHTGGNNLLNKMKLIRVEHIICNSVFTKRIIDKEFGVDSVVVYPPVDTDKIKSRRKENIILSVGRFSQLKQHKGQDILINVFKKIVNEGLKGWKLVLAGGAEIGVGNYVDALRGEAQGYPIEIILGPEYKTLKELYGKSKIFWSASGFGEREEENPDKVEHFGITVVEAMAARTVPVVYNAGGHKEIIEDGINGFLWNDLNSLENITQNLIQNPGKIISISKKANEKSKAYSFKNFEEKITELIR